MARKPLSTPVAADLEGSINTEQLNQDAQALTVLGKQTALVSKQLGYELDYQRERVVQEARFYMAQSAEAMLEAGKRLILIKEHEPHGMFIQIIEEQLGLTQSTAKRMMQAALKFSHPALSNRPALGDLGKTKLFELMLEDDASLIELAEGGTIAGLSLDEIDRMSCRELKAALREERAEHKAKQTVLDETTQKYNQLKTKQARIVPTPPDAVAKELRAELTKLFADAEGSIRGTIRQGLMQLQEHALDNNFNHDEFMSGVFGQLERCVAEVRSELGIKQVADGDVRPQWMRDLNLAPTATAED